MLECDRTIYSLAQIAGEAAVIDLVTFLLGCFVGLGAGLVYAKAMFRQTIEMKADTGIRLESGGRLYTVQSVEIE